MKEKDKTFSLKGDFFKDGKGKKEEKDAAMPMYFLCSCPCTFQRPCNHLTAHSIWFLF